MLGLHQSLRRTTLMSKEEQTAEMSHKPRPRVLWTIPVIFYKCQWTRLARYTNPMRPATFFLHTALGQAQAGHHRWPFLLPPHLPIQGSSGPLPAQPSQAEQKQTTKLHCLLRPTHFVKNTSPTLHMFKKISLIDSKKNSVVADNVSFYER